MMSHQSPAARAASIHHSPRAAHPRGSGTGTSAEAGTIWKELESVYSSSPMPALPARMLGGPREHLGGGSDSMLAYTERMREISRFRQDSVAYLAGESLSSPASQHSGGRPSDMQARHIAKLGKGGRSKEQQDRRQRQRRRPMSLDDEITRPRNRQNPADPTTLVNPKQNQRPLSDIPPQRTADSSVNDMSGEVKDDQRVRINFVSAADLFELVDFGLRSKRTRIQSNKLVPSAETLRLIQEASLLRAALGKGHRTKAVRTKGRDEQGEEKTGQRSSLMVHGTSSPQDSPRINDRSNHESRNGDKSVGGWFNEVDYDDGEWAERDEDKRILNSVSSFGNNDAEDGSSESFPRDRIMDADLELLLEKRLLLLHPQKLMFRPKRAKRMRLHRSQLSAIPEDERHRMEELAAHAQQEITSSTSRMTSVPTSSSLAAIKDFRKQNDASKAEATTSPSKVPNSNNAETKSKTKVQSTSNSHATDVSFDNGHRKTYRGPSLIEYSSDKGASEKPWAERTNDEHSSTNTASTGQHDVHSNNTPRELASDSRRSPTKAHSSRQEAASISPRRRQHDTSPRKTGGGSSSSDRSSTLYVSPTGSEVSPKAKAQKKFKKLIFLRDQPDFVHGHPVRYS